MTWRSQDSLENARKYFPMIPSMFVPDMAFMVGPISPDSSPIYDVLILGRNDHETRVEHGGWNIVERAFDEANITYVHRDWKLPDRMWMNPGYDKTDMVERRIALGNQIVSEARIVVTDRLHATIFATLLGRPVVYIDNIYGKIRSCREAAFQGTPECHQDNLQAFEAKDPLEASSIALRLLEEIKRPIE
ncbi:hypothetical protein HDU93_003352 [Gonapodya sp. JEL0774]|nr:hypothetical protein HDU93_003352 [Gonapodya sp. JEL0774]